MIIKKIIAFALCLVMLCSAVMFFPSCSLESIKENGTDLIKSMQYDYALITMPDGSEYKLELEGWAHTAEESYTYLYGKDGEGYIVGSRNYMLVNDPEIDIDVTSFSTITFDIKAEEVVIKKPSGELMTITYDDSKIGTITKNGVLKDENGVIYGVHGDNMWVKFSYEK